MVGIDTDMTYRCSEPAPLLALRKQHRQGTELKLTFLGIVKTEEIRDGGCEEEQRKRTICIVLIILQYNTVLEKRPSRNFNLVLLHLSTRIRPVQTMPENLISCLCEWF